MCCLKKVETRARSACLLFGAGMHNLSLGARLVDLQTGQVLWFNRLARGSGCLREEKSAGESIDALMSGFPEVR
jgi:hypothetical protein